MSTVLVCCLTKCDVIISRSSHDLDQRRKTVWKVSRISVSLLLLHVRHILLSKTKFKFEEYLYLSHFGVSVDNTITAYFEVEVTDFETTACRFQFNEHN